MSKPDTIMIRYTGSDHARRFVIQRSDFKYWTGEGWDKILDKAQTFTDHKTAQTTGNALQYQRYKGKAVRSFKVEVNITLVADEVGDITQAQLAEFLSRCLRLDMENSIHGDGPVDGSYVQARVHLSSLEEVEPTRKKF